MIALTDKAIARVRQQLAQRGQGIGIKVDVVRSGCSGFSYHMDFVDVVADNELTQSYDDFMVIVDKDDLPMLDGLELDVKTQGLNQFFAFNNPQATGTCGCGTSFSVK